MANNFDPTATTLFISFPSVEAAKFFKTWLSEIGEQDYWNASGAPGYIDLNFDYINPGGNHIMAYPIDKDD